MNTEIAHESKGKNKLKQHHMNVKSGKCKFYPLFVQDEQLY